MIQLFESPVLKIESLYQKHPLIETKLGFSFFKKCPRNKNRKQEP